MPKKFRTESDAKDLLSLLKRYQMRGVQAEIFWRRALGARWKKICVIATKQMMLFQQAYWFSRRRALFWCVLCRDFGFLLCAFCQIAFFGYDVCFQWQMFSKP